MCVARSIIVGESVAMSETRIGVLIDPAMFGRKQRRLVSAGVGGGGGPNEPLTGHLETYGCPVYKDATSCLKMRS